MPLVALATGEDAFSATAAAIGAPPPTVYDVATFGAVGDGQADDTDAIQAALDAANANGGGTLVFHAGTFRLTRALTIYSRIVLRGAGIRATLLTKSAGAGRYPIIRSPGFDPGQENAETIHSFSLQDISLDGNRDGGALGHGVQVSAYGFTLLNCSIFDCAGRGLWTEYHGDLPADGQTQEAMIANVSVHHCTEGGILWDGPHDSQWANIIVYSCGPPGVERGSTTCGVETGPRAAGLRATNCHVWGANHAYAWFLNTLAPGLVNCWGEGAEKAQVVVTSNDAHIVGGMYFAARDDRQTVGIQIGHGDLAPAATVINTKVVNCDLGSLYFVNDNGIGRYTLHVWQPTGKVVVVRPGATMRRSNRFDLQAHGGAEWGDLGDLKPVTFQQDVLTTGEFEARGSVRVGSPASTVGFFGATPVPRSSGWAVNGIADRRSLDGTSDLAAVREVLGTLIRELERYGLTRTFRPSD